MINVIPESVLRQFAKTGSGESVRLRSPEERQRLYSRRPLTKQEVFLGYHKCPECGFPTKNRYRCHGCWEIFDISIEPELPARIDDFEFLASILNE